MNKEITCDIAALREEMKELDNQRRAIWARHHDIEQQVHKWLVQRLIDTQALSKLSWDLRLSANMYPKEMDDIFLGADGDTEDGKELRDFLNVLTLEFSSTLEIWRDEELGIATAELQLDHDGDFYLTFGTNKTMWKFMREFNLSVSTTELTTLADRWKNRREEAENALNILRNIEGELQ